MRIALIAVVCVTLTAYGKAPDDLTTLRNRSFSATDLDGETVNVQPSETPAFTVVCFLGAECPVARLYAPRLQRLSQEFDKQGVQFVGVGSNLHDSEADLREFAKATEMVFPLVKDYDNRIADQYAAERTAEVYVLDRELTIRYRGRVDNEFQPGVKRSQATKQELKRALQELVAGQEVSVPRTEGVGCLIGRVSQGEISTDHTYAKEVSRILQKHCIECHKAGEIGPFALTDYEEIVGWGPMMVEVIEEQRMPPWNADPQHGSFRNARRMPDEDKRILKEWVAGGMPFGNAEELPPAPEVTEAAETDLWQLDREPDLVLPMGNKKFNVPADEFVEYQYYVVDPGFEEETWITGAQVIPGNRAVVHHCIVFVRPPDGSDTKGVGWLTGYVPGQRATPFDPGYARRIPAGSKLVFQMHYTPTGSEEEDLTKIGLMLADESEITHEVFTLIAINNDFEIPPNLRDFPVSASQGRLPKDGKLLAAIPHMHLRGKSFELFAEEGPERKTLLHVPKYDFNWQHVYSFEKPLDLNQIDRLTFTARFDNSAENPSNPDPSAYVTWGDQTYQEMAIAFFEVAVPRRKSASDSLESTPKKRTHSVETQQAAEEYADRYLKRYDANDDGEIEREELPISVGRYGFNTLDRDGNRLITHEEIRQAFLRRQRP